MKDKRYSVTIVLAQVQLSIFLRNIEKSCSFRGFTMSDGSLGEVFIEELLGDIVLFSVEGVDLGRFVDEIGFELDLVVPGFVRW